MTVLVLGELSLSAAVPLLATLKAGLQTAVGIALPDLQGRIAGLGSVLAAITVAPPDISATISAAIATVASLQAGISGPTVTLEAAAIVTLLAELTATLGVLTAAVDISIPSASLSAYVYTGPTAQLGAEVQAALDASLPGAPAQTYALIFATTSSAAWAGASAVFRVS
jgi:hypothetical protein